MEFDDPHFLVDREDTTVTTEEKNEAEDCPALPGRAWENISFGRDPGYTAGKFLCYGADDSSKKPAFMRIYSQIPLDGTEFSKPETRAKQAVPMKPIAELVALKRLKRMGWDVVPGLLGFQEETQGPDGFFPGGFITFVVWEKVAGEPLDYDGFWNMNYNMRDSIRYISGVSRATFVEPTED
ncbi:uncharacterized protein N7487_008964 [Penicillium crustosum]|uniref:uncharacterized protein n=1 Tax=Penicillium crustosum TaxID=36656 RepID=UPI00238C274F|nr:uncharacterized protein N7487_008964 [Penicillium crustosum]KAJ5403068.1 hypothetical protein N7487_008964 [Penicillium crustosum]